MIVLNLILGFLKIMFFAFTFIPLAFLILCINAGGGDLNLDWYFTFLGG